MMQEELVHKHERHPVVPHFLQRPVHRKIVFRENIETRMAGKERAIILQMGTDREPLTDLTQLSKPERACIAERRIAIDEKEHPVRDFLGLIVIEFQEEKA